MLMRFIQQLSMISFLLNLSADAKIIFDPHLQLKSPGSTFEDHSIILIGNSSEYSVLTTVYDGVLDSTCYCNKLWYSKDLSAGPIYRGNCTASTAEHDQNIGIFCTSNSESTLKSGAKVIFYKNGQVEIHTIRSIWAGFTNDDPHKRLKRKSGLNVLNTKGKGIGVILNCHGNRRV